MEKGRMLIVVPAYNEENNIPGVIGEIRAHLPGADILVVNDCSFDATPETARRQDGVKVVDLPCNLGIGGAVQTGFKYARDHGYDYMVQIDGDGQHLPGEVSKLAAAMAATGCDMVIGSRFLDIRSFRTSWQRRFGIKTFQYLFRLLLGLAITDSTSGFRLYNRNSIEILARQYSSDYPEPDAIVLLHKHGLTISETGVAMRARENGSSSITALKSPYYMAKVTLSIIFSCLRTRW
jgi:glycosyltransferase involved in cell wall biosynthesis